MNMKKIFAVVSAASMLTTCALADAPVPIKAAPEQTTPETTIAAPEFTPAYTYNTVTVTGITNERITATTNTEKKDDPRYEIDFTILDKTIVLDGNTAAKKTVADIKEGDTITVFTDSYSPAPLILPPLYQADVIALFGTEAPKSQVLVDVFAKRGDEYVSTGNSLRVATGDETAITDVDGNKFEGELDGKVLAIFYTMETKSIPPLTNPEKVVVIGEKESVAEEEIKVDFSKIKSVKVGDVTMENIYVNGDGTLMIPLRASLEAKGLSVAWNGERNEVVIEGGKFGLAIGTNSYIKGKMMPLELSCAPELHNDLTYVPFDFYTEVIESTVNLNEDSIEISFE